MENEEWKIDGELNACCTKLIQNESLKLREKMLLQEFLLELDYKSIEKYRKIISVRDRITEILKSQIKLINEKYD